MEIKERFLNYVKFDTKSDEESQTYPSTASQKEFAKMLLNELKSMGIDNSFIDEYSNVYAHLDGDNNLSKIGLIAHMDTSPSLDGGNYNPRFIKNYDGQDIKLCDEYTLTREQFPSLNNNIGDDLIVTDGYHLLGGDDKAGIAIIMQVLEYYQTHKDVKHAPIRVCFTPDEEIGLGSLHFDVKKMDADFAYTLDGERFNDINYENFNAASCKIEINGVGVHPGSAKNIMINAISVGNEFDSMLPKNEVPEKTENYEGFYHITSFNATPEKAIITYILRDHDIKKLNDKKNNMLRIGKILSEKYKTASIKVTVKDSYKNMRTYFDKDMSVIDKIVKAYQKNHIDVTFTPIRGGTDGASITFMGLPCPNLGVGDYNCHGRFEYVSLTEMNKMVEVIKTLLENNF